MHRDRRVCEVRSDEPVLLPAVRDRDALLRAVFAKISATFQAVITSAIPDDTVAPQELAYAPIKALVQVIENDPSMARILFVESGAEPLLRQLRSELMTDFAELVLREARLHLDIPSDVLQVADLAATYGVGGLFEILRRWIDGQLNLSTEMLIEHGAGFLGSLGLYTLGQAPDQAAPLLAAVDENR
ncbi:transcriptional regulator [Mycobacteroides abscessus]|nr:transcriptional regulator [Mycobacteroides abscessus]